MAEKIIQVIPCEAPIYAVYRDEKSGESFKEPIHFLGLTDNGEVTGLSLFSGYFMPCDDTTGFDGLYREREVVTIRDYSWNTERFFGAGGTIYLSKRARREKSNGNGKHGQCDYRGTKAIQSAITT